MIKKENKHKGQYGEDIAAEYLMRNGSRIIQRNFSCKFGEIDIIARDGDTLVFIEVKYRQSTAYGLPGQAVNRKKQQHIIKSALCYLQTNHMFDTDVRFDILEVLDIDHTLKIRQNKNAFDMSAYQ